MKTKLLLCIAFITMLQTTLAQTIAIPDPNFEQALIDAGQDTDGIINGLILQSDAEDVITLALNNKGINDLLGIEGFINVISIDCDNNNLTNLNLSSNSVLQTLNCSNNNLASLNISNNTSLTSIIAIGSQLTSLDVSNNTLLTYLSVPFNQISSLDVSNNTALATLHVHSNELTNLDVSNLTLLQTLYCYSNDITSLNVSNATALENLHCYGNLFTSLNVNTNINLKELHCSNGELLSIDVSNNIHLEEFKCWGNQLTSVNLKNGNNTNITVFIATNNADLTCIDVDNVTYSNTNWTNIDAQTIFSEDCSTPTPTIPIYDTNFEQALIDLGYDTNGFTGDILQSEAEAVTTLDVSNRNINDLQGIEGFTNLITLNCYGNSLSNLDVSNNHLLESLDCSDNNLSIFIVNNNPALKSLNCRNNQLSVLNIASSVLLENLNIYINNIAILDLSTHTALTFLLADSNALERLDIKNGNNTNVSFFSAVGNPNLNCIEVDNTTYSLVNWTFIDAQTGFSDDCNYPALINIPDANFEQALIGLGYDTNGLTGSILQSEAEAVTSLDIPNEDISSLQGIESFINLQFLNCYSNNLTSLDVTNLSALEVLYGDHNNITALDVSQNINLETLICSSNPLTSLDVDNNIALENLICSSTQITTLDVTLNPNLEHLRATNNQLLLV